MKKRSISTIATGLLLLFSLSSCGTSAATNSTNIPSAVSTEKANGTEQPQNNSTQKPAAEKIIRMGAISAPSGIFNPLYSNDDWTAYVTNLIFQSLVTSDEKANLMPNLAESWDISEDSKTVTFHLFKNIKWTDGEPFTAEDIKFTLELMADKNYTGTGSTSVQPILGFEEKHDGTVEHISGINVIDEYTISITTKEIYASFFEKIGRGIRIIAKHIWEDIPAADMEQKTDLLKNPVGTGPFVLSEYVPDQYTLLVKNPEYFRGSPKIDKFVIQTVNPETVQAQLLNNDLDLMQVESLSPDEIKIYEDANFEARGVLLGAYQHMVVNHSVPLLGKKAFRQAMTYAINREGIVTSLLYGYGNVANTAYAKASYAYPGDSELNDYAYSPEKAKEILTAEVGLQYKDGILYDGENPVKLTLVYPSGNKAREGAAAIIQQNFKEIGIDLKLELVEFATLTSILQDKKADNFQLALLGTNFGADGDGTSLVGTGSANNYARYSSPKTDELLAEGLKHLDYESRAPIYKELGKVLNEDLPVIYLYNWQRFTIINPRLKGVKVSTYYPLYGDVEKWDIIE